MARANTSFLVPVSPSRSTEADVAATCATAFSAVRATGLRPTMPPTPCSSAISSRRYSFVAVRLRIVRSASSRSSTSRRITV
jgi:hypothetical protein